MSTQRSAVRHAHVDLETMMRFRRASLGKKLSAVRSAPRAPHLTRPRGWAALAGAVLALVLALVGVAVADVHPGASPRTGAAGPDPAAPAAAGSRSAGPGPAERLAARYADVGVRDFRVDASGGRSIVEVLPGQVNGDNVARAWRREGYRGCWAFALGTNDTANASVGSAVGRMGRIEEMMSVAHGEPVLWVNVRTLDASGSWAEGNMQLWNGALREACAKYPNMRIFDWASVASPAWFISDGIHYTSAGYAARAQAIADALARAFGRGGDSRSCPVR